MRACMYVHLHASFRPSIHMHVSYIQFFNISCYAMHSCTIQTYIHSSVCAEKQTSAILKCMRESFVPTLSTCNHPSCIQPPNDAVFLLLLYLPFFVTNSLINSMSYIAQLIDSLIRNNYASIYLFIYSFI